MKRSPEEYEAARKAAIARETAIADQILRDGVNARRRKASIDSAKDSPVFFHLHAVALHAKQLLGPSADALAAARKVEARYYPPGFLGKVKGALRRAFARMVCLVLGHLAYTCRTVAPLGCEGKDCGEFLEFVEACASCGKVQHDRDPERASDKTRRMRRRGPWAYRLTRKALDGREVMPSDPGDLALGPRVETFATAKPLALVPPPSRTIDAVVNEAVQGVPPWRRKVVK